MRDNDGIMLCAGIYFELYNLLASVKRCCLPACLPVSSVVLLSLSFRARASLVQLAESIFVG